jgi:hypothetical protein
MAAGNTLLLGGALSPVRVLSGLAALGRALSEYRPGERRINVYVSLLDDDRLIDQRRASDSDDPSAHRARWSGLGRTRFAQLGGVGFPTSTEFLRSLD